MSISAPIDVVERILVLVYEELGIQTARSLAWIDVDETTRLREMVEETGFNITGHNVAVLCKNLQHPGHIFITLCINLGIKAFQLSSSVTQDSGYSGATATAQQIKSRLVSDLFDRSHPTSMFPRDVPAEVMTTGIMMMLIELVGFETEVWKKTKDEWLTMKWLAERIVDITIEECNSGSSRWA